MALWDDTRARPGLKRRRSPALDEHGEEDHASAVETLAASLRHVDVADRVQLCRKGSDRIVTVTRTEAAVALNVNVAHVNVLTVEFESVVDTVAEYLRLCRGRSGPAVGPGSCLDFASNEFAQPESVVRKALGLSDAEHEYATLLAPYLAVNAKDQSLQLFLAAVQLDILCLKSIAFRLFMVGHVGRRNVECCE